MSAWASHNWKVITTVGAVLASLGMVALGHVQSVDAQFVEIRIETVRDNATIEQIQRDVSEIKCVIVNQARGEDALSCL